MSKQWIKRLDADTTVPVSVTKGMCDICGPSVYGATFVGATNQYVTQDVWKAKNASDTQPESHILCSDITQHCRNKAYTNTVGWRK